VGDGIPKNTVYSTGTKMRVSIGAIIIPSIIITAIETKKSLGTEGIMPWTVV